MPVKDILNIIQPPNDSGIIPPVEVFYRSLQPHHIYVLWLASSASIAVFLIALIQITYVIKFVKQENLRSNIYFMISMPPVTCICSMIGMFVPKSAAFLYTVNVSYYMLCLYMVVTLMYAMFGSKRILIKYLQENAIPIKLAVPPYFTCLTCLPEFSNSRRNVTTIECLILQTVIIRMVSQIAEMVVFYEEENRNHVFFSITNGIGLLSMFTAFYFVYVMIDLGKERLAPYNFSVMFRLHDLAQSLCSIQKFGSDILIKMGFITGSDFLPATSTAMFYFNFLLCVEMLVLNCLALYLLRPSQTILFDSVEESATDDNGLLPGMTTSIEQERFLDQNTDNRNEASSHNSHKTTKKTENLSHEPLATIPTIQTPFTTLPITPDWRREASKPPRRSQDYSPLPKNESKEAIRQ